MMTPELPRVLMHEYRCPRCGFRWLQERFVEREICIQCQKWPVKSQGSEMIELGLRVPHPAIEPPRLACLICGRRGDNLVAMQEHACEHGYELEDHRRVTRRKTENAWIFTMPDGVDWLEARE